MRTPKLTPTSRALLEAIAAGHVTGMFSSQYDSPGWRSVPAIEGTRVGKFERADRSFYLVTNEVVNLIAGGYAAVERVGDFYTHVSEQHAAFVAAGIDDTSKRCDVVAVLTGAGREALGLAPAGESAPAVEVVTPAAKPSRTLKPDTAPRPSASAAAIASVLAFHPDQATAVHADEIGYRHSTVAATLRHMIAAGEVIATADVDGTPMYYLTEAARDRYTGPRRPWALAA